MTPRVPAEHVEAMKAAVERVLADGNWYANIVNPRWARKAIRAYVWAVYSGEPPLEALARACYGHDWNWRRRNDGEAAFQAWLRLDGHGFTEKVRYFESLNLTIPRSVALEAHSARWAA